MGVNFLSLSLWKEFMWANTHLKDPVINGNIKLRGFFRGVRYKNDIWMLNGSDLWLMEELVAASAACVSSCHTSKIPRRSVYSSNWNLDLRSKSSILSVTGYEQVTRWSDWCSYRALHLYSGGARFDTRKGQQLLWLTVAQFNSTFQKKKSGY
jgi:hypothetical protein